MAHQQQQQKQTILIAVCVKCKGNVQYIASTQVL